LWDFNYRHLFFNKRYFGSISLFLPDATPLCEDEAAQQGSVLFDFITETHTIRTADGITFADYEEVDDVTPENYSRLICELNSRDFGVASRA
jgi:hypothetical protein